MLANRTSVGLDVHARSVVACGLDGRSGELFERRLCPDHTEIIAWIRGLPGPVAVTYEAGPTGFGLARFLTREGIDCLVAAPSKLQRPAGDRVKTDMRDARHLARLLHLGEIVAVTVPSVEQEAARDLVRAREGVRCDLTAARHRLSKLLLRQGIVYYGGTARTGPHDRWLRAQRHRPVFDTPGLGTAFDIAYDTVPATTARRDRLDTAIAAMATTTPYRLRRASPDRRRGVHAPRGAGVKAPEGTDTRAKLPTSTAMSLLSGSWRVPFRDSGGRARSCSRRSADQAEVAKQRTCVHSVTDPLRSVVVPHEVAQLTRRRRSDNLDAPFAP